MSLTWKKSSTDGLRYRAGSDPGGRRSTAGHEGVFQAARKLTQKTGALLIADEIQSGLGRTGNGSRTNIMVCSRTS